MHLYIERLISVTRRVPCQPRRFCLLCCHALHTLTPVRLHAGRPGWSWWLLTGCAWTVLLERQLRLSSFKGLLQLSGSF